MSEVTEHAAGAADAATRPGRSASLVGAWAAFVGLLVLAVVHYAPRVLAGDPGIARLEPTLFAAAASARGAHDLGNGIEVSVFASGLRVETSSGTVLKTTERSAPVLLLHGGVRVDGDPPVEQVDDEQRVLAVDGVTPLGDRVRISGSATMADGRSVPVVLEVAGQGAGRFTLSMTAHEPIAGFAVALDPKFTDLLPPPDRDAESGAWWASGQEVLRTPRATGAWRVEVGGGRVAVDRRIEGVTMVHVWGSAPTLTFSAPTVGP